MFVDFGMAKRYDGVCYLRYDDTNPNAEKQVRFLYCDVCLRVCCVCLCADGYDTCATTQTPTQRSRCVFGNVLCVFESVCTTRR